MEITKQEKSKLTSSPNVLSTCTYLLPSGYVLLKVHLNPATISPFCANASFYLNVFPILLRYTWPIFKPFCTNIFVYFNGFQYYATFAAEDWKAMK